jgi:peptidyl-prolyl cis-trans isomerase A (cyclophilin A)
MRTLLALFLAAPAFADTTVAAATGPITLEEATKGLKGSGALTAKIEVAQAGKPMGTFTCELFDKQAPKTVANFIGLARGLQAWKDPKTGAWSKKPLYDGLTFHRVIPGFMIQGGDPKGDGKGDPGYAFEDEFVPELKMDKGGLLAMANRGPATNGSQFFITEKPAPWLSHPVPKHTIFGSCAPVDLVTKITVVPRGEHDAPAEPVIIKKVTISRGAKKK